MATPPPSRSVAHRGLPFILISVLLAATLGACAAPEPGAPPTVTAISQARSTAGSPIPSASAVTSAPTTSGSTSVPVPAASAAGEITVFAASSLTDAFTELGRQFQQTYPETTVAFNFGASTQLFTQIDQGASADVFASADQIQMDRAKAAGRIDGADRVFATNRLVIITPNNNPGNVQGPADLARLGLRVVTSQEDVPIGVYTQQVFEKMTQDARFGADFKDRVNANIVSREANVRQIVSKVMLGEADASIVYRSDVTPQVASQLTAIQIPDAFNTLASYPIARVQDGPNAAGAEAFITFVLSPIGQAALARWGFVAIGPVGVL